MPRSAVLDAVECHHLLCAGTFGRVALTTPGGPEIVPVNYRVVGGDIVVRTSPTSMLARWAHEAQVAFEVDLVDYERWVGWSVIARGVARVAPDTAEDPTVVARSGPRPWADGTRDMIVRLPWSTLSGRKLGSGWNALSAMPARTTSL